MGAADAKEVVAVLRGVHRMTEVDVVGGEAAVEDFAAHDVVLHVALAVAPGEGAVAVLFEPEHHAAPVDAFRLLTR